MFDPTVGRWLSEDPIEFEAGDDNLYRYVGNSPPNFTDPSGLDPGWLFNRPWDIPGEAWMLLFPPVSPDVIAAPVRPNFNPNQMNRPELKAGDVIDIDTRDYTHRTTQAFKSTLVETGIIAAMAMTPAMLEMQVSKFIPKYCKGSIVEVFPSQYLGNTVAEVQAASSGRNAPAEAKRAWKLLNDLRFRK